MAHKWAGGLPNPYRLGGATLLRGEQSEQWPKSGPDGCIPLAAWRVINASEQGTKSGEVLKWAGRLHNPCRPGGPQCLQARGQNQKWPTSGLECYILLNVWEVPIASERGTKCAMAHKLAGWLHNPATLGGTQHFKAGGQNQKRPTSGVECYIPLSLWGVPNASDRGTKSAMAHK